MSDGEIRIIRFANGQEVIGTVSEHDDGGITLKDSMVISISFKDGSQTDINLQMLPFLPIGKDTVKFPKKFVSEAIAFSYEPADAVVERYNKFFSKIVTPNKSIITP